MKTYIVQLEDHDDVISARDKIAWSKARRILLVWPRKGRVLERRVDLLLIQRHCQKLGGQLALVTKSSGVKAQADELGIPVFEDALAAQEASWRRQRRRSAQWLARLKRRKPANAQMLREQRLAEQRERREAFPARAAGNRWLRLGMFTVAVVAFLVLVLSFVPGAEIVVKPVHTPQQLDIEVWASPSIAAPSATGGLPAEVMLVVVEGRDQRESSGQAKIPEGFASGIAVLTNLTDQVVEVPAGSIVATTADPPVRFVTTQAARVLAGPEKEARAQIRAEAPGSAGNLPPGKIQAMEGPLGLRLRVTNNTATSGGTDRASKAPTTEDYRGLREQLLMNLEANALEEAQSRLMPGQRLLDGMLVLKRVVEEKREPPEGQPADQVQLSLRVEFAAWTVEEDDLQAVARAALDANTEKGLQAVPGSVKITFTSTPEVEGAVDQRSVNQGAVDQDDKNEGGEGQDGGLTARWNMRVEQALEKEWTEVGVVRSIQGRSVDEVKAILQTRLSLSEAPRINIYPSWWGRLPYLPARIKVVSQ